MALLVWLPLNKEGLFLNQGLANVTFTRSSGTYNSNGKIGGCYEFSGLTGTGINASDNGFMSKYINNHSWSICVWIKSTNANTPIMSLSYGLRLFSGSNAYVNLSNSTRSVRCHSRKATNDGNWHHIVATYDVTTNKITMYIDGSYSNSVNYTSGYTYSSSWTNGLFIGRDPNNKTIDYFYLGALSDVRIYDHCLSPKEVHEIAKGLVLHYPMNDEYAESTINLGNNGSVSGWNNSGNSIRNGNDTSIPKILDSLPVYSIKVTTAGNCAITFSSVNASSFKGQTVAASCWFYTNSSVSASTPYLRSSINNNVITLLKYNGTTNPTTWPKNLWIRLTGTGTVDPNETSIYFCDYANNLNEFRAYTCWQLELKDHVTPYTPTTRNELVYDCSGYCNNGTVTGSLQVVDDSPRYKKSTKFNGVNERINIPSTFTKSDQLTVSLWSYCTKSNLGNKNIFSLEYNNYWQFNIVNNYIYVRDSISGPTGNRRGISFGTIPANEWNHLTAVYDKGTIKTYLNGELINVNTSTSTRTLNWDNINWCCIGSAHSDGYYFDGSLSDVRIYSTALSDDDIKELYNTSAIINNNNTLLAYEFVE